MSTISQHKPLIVVLILMSTCTGVTGTTIIAARNAHEVVLAADGKGHSLENPSITSTHCKIFSCGPYFVGFAGVRELKVKGPKFSVPPLLREACKSPGKATARLNRIADFLIGPYTEVMAELRNYEPAYYARALLTKEIYLNIVMIGVENDVPFILGKDLIPPSEGLTLVQTRDTGQTDRLAPDVIDYLFAGRHEGIDEFVKTRNAFWRLGIAEGAKFLITYQIADLPSIVGPPIDIVSITKDGPKWIQQSAECAEVNGTTKTKPAARRTKPHKAPSNGGKK